MKMYLDGDDSGVWTEMALAIGLDVEITVAKRLS